MTNLKKVLALSLAATSVLSSATLASFTDDNTIQSKDAVDTLVALEIIKGYEDGTFRPEATVTRAEMAKMIFTIKNGGSDDASMFKTLPTSFKDVSGHWAEGYIKYCQSQGIIAGKSDTVFDPNGKITGTQALKMSLTVLGYKADKSNLVGPNWVTNTVALSTQNGLTQDYIGDIGVESMRQSAAQILYNSLYTETVRFSNLYDDYQSTSKTLAEEALNLTTISEVVITSSTKDNGLSYKQGTDVYTVKSDKDFNSFVNQKVDILVDAKTKKVYGVKSYDTNKVINTTKNNVTVSGNSGSKTVKYNNVTIKISDTNATDIENAKANSTVNVVDNGTDVTVKITDALVGKVTFVNKDKIHVNVAGFTTGQLTFEDDNIPTKVKKDDYVLITENDFTLNQDVQILDQKTGDVSAIKGQEIRIDGVWFSLNTGETLPSLNDTVSYFEVGGVLYGVEKTAEQSTATVYVVAAEVGTSLTSTNKAKVVFEDGTTKVINTKNDETTNVGKIVTYTINSNDEYTFTAISSDYTEATLSGNIYDKDTKKLAGSYVSDSALVYVKHTTDKYSVLTGEQVKNFNDINTVATTSNTTVYTKVKNGIAYAELAFIDLGADKLPSTAGTEKYALVLDAPYTIRENDVNYTVVTVFDGEKQVDIKTENADAGVAKGTYVTYEVSNDNKADKVELISGLTTDAVKGYSEKEGTIIFDGATTSNTDDIYAKITSNTVIVYVDSENNNGVEGGSIVIAEDMTGDGVIEKNVKVLLDGSDVVAIFVDVNNNMQ